MCHEQIGEKKNWAKSTRRKRRRRRHQDGDLEEKKQQSIEKIFSPENGERQHGLTLKQIPWVTEEGTGFKARCIFTEDRGRTHTPEKRTDRE